MRKIIFLLTILIVLVSCNKNNKSIQEPINYTNAVEITNKPLLEELKSYIDSVENVNKRIKFYCTYVEYINDSVSRVQVTYVEGLFYDIFLPTFFFVVHIDNKPVFFSMIVQNKQPRIFFRNRQEIIDEIMQKYDPARYKAKLHFEKTGQLVATDDILDESSEKILDLVFVNDRIVRRVKRGGVISKGLPETKTERIYNK